MSKFDSLLATFGDTIGIPGLAADSSGICMLSFDDIEVVIQHITDGEMLLLYGYLGPIPPDYQEDLFKYCLAANSFFRDTGGSTIGIDSATNAVGLHIAYPLVALEDESFENLLENFVNMAENWIQKIERFPAVLNETGGGVSESPLQKALDEQAMRSASSEKSLPDTTGRPQGAPQPPVGSPRPQGAPQPPVGSPRPQGAPQPPVGSPRPQGMPPPPPVGSPRPQGAPPPPPSTGGVLPPKK